MHPVEFNTVVYATLPLVSRAEISSAAFSAQQPMLEAPYNVTRGSAKLQRKKAIDNKQRQVTRPIAVKRDARDLAELRMRGALQLALFDDYGNMTHHVVEIVCL